MCVNYMDYVSVIIDSVETSINLKLFKNREESTLAHIFKSKLEKIPLSLFKNVDNFNPELLQKSAIKSYPLSDRPRGDDDISSIKFYQKQIQQKIEIQPIWIIKKNKKYILLDGAHRVVSSYIENKHFVYAYIING